MINFNNINGLLNQSNVKCNKKITIPDGFRDLLIDLTVEVLKTQPTDLLDFSIKWLVNRKNTRNKILKDETHSNEISDVSGKKKFGISKIGSKVCQTKPPHELIEECQLFMGIEKNLIENLLHNFDIKSVENGETLKISGEEQSNKIYIVKSGNFELFSELPFGKIKIAELKDFGYFGDTIESIICMAKTAGSFVVLNRSDIDDRVWNEISKRREEYTDYIDELEVFEKLSSYEKRLLIDSLIFRFCVANNEIIKENTEANEMFLIYEGFVSVQKDGKEIATVNEGGYFGEMGLLDDQPRIASIISITDTKLLVIKKDVFKSIIEPKCADYMDTAIKKYLGDDRTDDDDDDDEDASSVLATPPNEKVNMPRQSVSAGKFNPEIFDDDEDDDEMDEEMNNQDYSKTDEQRNRLRKVCKDILLFRCLDSEQLEVVINGMFKKIVAPGDIVITKGENGDNFYVIDNGLYDIIIPVNNEDKVVAQYNNKGSFGELALMYNTPRSATVTAKTNGLLWAMSRDMFRKIVLKKAFQKRLLYDNLLGQVPFLKELSSYERNNVADALRTRIYEPGDMIIKQGEEGLEMYFIEEGTATIFIQFNENLNPEEVGKLETGSYFGEMALINKKPRAATIIAKTKCKIAALDRESFERLLGPCVEIMKRDMLGYNTEPSSRIDSETDS